MGNSDKRKRAGEGFGIRTKARRVRLEEQIIELLLLNIVQRRHEIDEATSRCREGRLHPSRTEAVHVRRREVRVRVRGRMRVRERSSTETVSERLLARVSE